MAEMDGVALATAIKADDPCLRNTILIMLTLVAKRPKIMPRQSNQRYEKKLNGLRRIGSVATLKEQAQKGSVRHCITSQSGTVLR